jgi:hypothetical protein
LQTRRRQKPVEVSSGKRISSTATALSIVPDYFLFRSVTVLIGSKSDKAQGEEAARV